MPAIRIANLRGAVMLRTGACTLILVVVVVVGCRRRDPAKPPVVVEQKPDPVEAAALKFTNGLDDKDRTEFYHLAEGSEVYPLDWLKVLLNKDSGKPFLDDLERMGFLRDDRPGNEDRLPVGLTAAITRGLEPMGKMVGINCAACHVGQLTYKGKAMRIDGAPNLVDTREFFKSLVESALHTAEDPEKLVAFLGRLHNLKHPTQNTIGAELQQTLRKLLGGVLEKEAAALKSALMPVIKNLLEDAKAESKTADLAPPAKPSADDFRRRLLGSLDVAAYKNRLDDSLLKKVLDHLPNAAARENGLLKAFEEIYIGIRLLKARGEYLQRLGLVGTDPRTVWGPGRVDAFGSARAFLFEKGYPPVAPVSYPFIWNFERISWLHYDGNTTSVMVRNMGQALGVGAVADADPGNASATLHSSLRPVNLDRLERLAAKITPPRWPVELFDKVDAEKANRGEKLFQEHCAKCHVPFDTKNNADALDLLFDVKTVGTDPVRADTFAQRLPKDGPFKGVFFFEAIRDTMAKIRDKSYEDNEITPEQQKAFDKGRPNDWRGTDKYAARPIVAIWATAPYLHNGSVPTLDDLLKPAKDRPRTFYIGSREYDPEKLGYVTHAAGKDDNFDTTKPGNGNQGHEYGTALADAQRRDLLEYLKIAGVPQE